MSATSGDYGVTIPSAPTVNANPGAVPDPGVGTDVHEQHVVGEDVLRRGAGRVLRADVRITDADGEPRLDGHVGERDLPQVGAVRRLQPPPVLAQASPLEGRVDQGRC